MLRLQSKTGWWLVTHVDHAHLAGAFAERWGNDRFLTPEPRERVLRGVHAHDDGWAARDQHPQITRQGKPSAFSVELVGKYSAFEEIDLADYLAVRDRAVSIGGAVSAARVGGARVQHRALDRDASWRSLRVGRGAGVAGWRHC